MKPQKVFDLYGDDLNLTPDDLPEEFILPVTAEPMRKKFRQDKDRNRFLQKQEKISEDLAYWENILKNLPDDKVAKENVAKLKEALKTKRRLPKSDTTVLPSTKSTRRKKPEWVAPVPVV